MIAPQILSPAYLKLGGTAQRAAALAFLPLADIAAFIPLPKAIGIGVTITSDTIDVRGYNVFFAVASASGANLSFRINEIDPNGTTVVTRTIATVPAGAGSTPMTAGFGNTAALGGNDVFDKISLSFVNVGAAPATLDSFPGLWCTVR